MENPSENFVITRVFDAPRELIWKAFTERERLAQWWGPKGFDLEVAKLDLVAGGVFLYAMRSAGGNEMWGKFVYREIMPPERLSFVVSFSDAEGGTTRAPWDPTWPLEVLNVMTLTEQDGKTTMTVTGGPINATEEERRTYVAGFESMRQGFGGSFEKLAAYLESVR